MPREALGPLALVGVALVFLTKAALSWPGFGHVVTSLLSGAVGLAVIVFVAWCLCSGSKSRTVVGHSHGGNRRVRATHEAGHYVAAKAVGGYVAGAELTRHGGVVHAKNLPNAQAQATFLLAGRYAAGTGQGCSGDDDAAAAAINEYPARERARRRAAAERDARRIVNSRRGEIRRIAERLDKNGHA